jgi:hypothetical protein
MGSQDGLVYVEIRVHKAKAGIDLPLATARDFPPGTTTALADPVFSPDGSRFGFVRYATDQPPTSGSNRPSAARPYAWPANTWCRRSGSRRQLHGRSDGSRSPLAGGHHQTRRDKQPHAIAGDWLACEARSGVELFSADGSRHKGLRRLDSSAIAFSHDGLTLYAAGRDAGQT